MVLHFWMLSCFISQFSCALPGKKINTLTKKVCRNVSRLCGILISKGGLKGESVHSRWTMQILLLLLFFFASAKDLKSRFTSEFMSVSSDYQLAVLDSGGQCFSSLLTFREAPPPTVVHLFSQLLRGREMAEFGGKVTLYPTGFSIKRFKRPTSNNIAECDCTNIII